MTKYMGIGSESIVIEKMPSAESTFSLLSLINQQRSLVRRLRDELRLATFGGVISGFLLESLFDITQKLRMVSMPVVELVVTTLLDKPTSLTKKRVFEMLKVYAAREKNAAYECALAYMGMAAEGRFNPGQSHPLAVQFLYYATKLGHPEAFFTMLHAINDRCLSVSGGDFLKYCEKLVAKTNNLNVAIAIGTILCGLDIDDHENLRSILNLYDPDKGFQYLRRVQVQAKAQGNMELSEIAFLTIQQGYRTNIYTSQKALDYRMTLTPITPIESPSQSPRLL